MTFPARYGPPAAQGARDAITPGLRPVAAASGKRLASLIYDLVREQLLEGAYQAGDRLQIEMLKAEYGVSKQPIMDALRRLASDGLIEIIPQVGCRVPVYEPEDIAAFFAIFGGTEGAVAGVAAQRCTAEQLSSLAVVNADILRLAADPSPAARAHRYRILNRQFHGIVHAMAHSPVVAEISRRMWDMSDLIINTSGGPQPLAFAVPARHEDHERIIAALQRADPEGARAEMETHILGTVAVIQPSAGGPGPLPGSRLTRAAG
jgi:DNA-binding GntR family transcriptional regulator